MVVHDYLKGSDTDEKISVRGGECMLTVNQKEIWRLMSAQDLIPADLSRLAGISAQSVRKIIFGNGKLQFAVINKLAKFFNVEFDSIIAEKG